MESEALEEMIFNWGQAFFANPRFHGYF